MTGPAAPALTKWYVDCVDAAGRSAIVYWSAISWRGILQQYAGRLHRAHATKADIQVIDFVDEGQVALLRMWEKRKAGYKAMGYRLNDASATMALL